MPALRKTVTSDSWIEDVQYALRVFSRGDTPEVSEEHMHEYLFSRYEPQLALLEKLAVQASLNWLVRNGDELEQVGLRVHGPNGSGFVNALLYALHDVVFKDPRPSWWAQVPDVELAPVVQQTQRFIDLTKRD